MKYITHTCTNCKEETKHKIALHFKKNGEIKARCILCDTPIYKSTTDVEQKEDQTICL